MGILFTGSTGYRTLVTPPSVRMVKVVSSADSSDFAPHKGSLELNFQKLSELKNQMSDLQATFTYRPAFPAQMLISAPLPFCVSVSMPYLLLLLSAIKCYETLLPLFKRGVCCFSAHPPFFPPQASSSLLLLWKWCRLALLESFLSYSETHSHSDFSSAKWWHTLSPDDAWVSTSPHDPQPPSQVAPSSPTPHLVSPLSHSSCGFITCLSPQSSSPPQLPLLLPCSPPNPLL